MFSKIKTRSHFPSDIYIHVFSREDEHTGQWEVGQTAGKPTKSGIFILGIPCFFPPFPLHFPPFFSALSLPVQHGSLNTLILEWRKLGCTEIKELAVQWGEKGVMGEIAIKN